MEVAERGLKNTTSTAKSGHKGDKSVDESGEHKACVKITCQSCGEAEE